jgi:hypothetical protein
VEPGGGERHATIVGHNWAAHKAALHHPREDALVRICALANKLARICYATLRDKTPFGETELLSRHL